MPCSDGQADVGLDLIRNVGADSAHGSQRLRDQCEPGGIPPTGNAARRHLQRAAWFGLGQQPQVGFRTLAVHVPSVLLRRAVDRQAGVPGLMLRAGSGDLPRIHPYNTQSPGSTWSRVKHPDGSQLSPARQGRQAPEPSSLTFEPA